MPYVNPAEPFAENGDPSWYYAWLMVEKGFSIRSIIAVDEMFVFERRP